MSSDEPRVRLTEFLTLEIVDGSGQYLYEIDLERCKDSASLLDYLLQVFGKTWCTPSLMFAIFQELDRACEAEFGKTAQATFCCDGINHRVKWPVMGSYVA